MARASTVEEDLALSNELSHLICSVYDADQLVRGIRDDRDHEASIIANEMRARGLKRYVAGPLVASFVKRKEAWCACCRVPVQQCPNYNAGKPITGDYIEVEFLQVKPNPKRGAGDEVPA